MNETALIEAYLLGTLSPEERTVFEARLLIDDELSENTALQRQLYDILRNNARQQLRKEIAAIDQQLFSEKKYAPFRQRIFRIFKP